MQIIPREIYATQVDAWIGKGQIVVLTGQRRVGKSYVMKDFVQRHQQEPDANIVISYSAYFAEAYLTVNVPRYDIHGKRLLETAGKTYFGDVGLRNYIVGGERENDVEKVMENVVYQHLCRLGYEVTVGQLRAGEVDFVCTRQRSSASREKSRVYVQVAYVIASDDTRQREFGILQNISDSYPKYVISATPLLRASDYNGVTHLSLRKFLTEGLGND